ncbi:MAG TPA: hypothetical protein PLA94_31940, partial [Myxococcota bacterium]|nr:hypothetical protein [Myxococcota bacterium]
PAPQRRGLSTEEGRNQRTNLLEQWLEGEREAAVKGADRVEEPGEILCSAEGLRLRLWPVEGADSAVVYRILPEGGAALSVGGAQLRLGRAPLPVPPAATYQLDLPGLSVHGQKVEGVTTTTVFRVRQDGEGRRQGPELQPGGHYRLLLPPGVEEAGATLLPDGWGLWELNLSPHPSPELRRKLEARGLEVVAPLPRLVAAGRAPVDWREHPRLGLLPVYLPHQKIHLELSACPGLLPGELQLLLWGASGARWLKLEGDGPWWVELDGAEELRVAELLAERAAIPSQRWAFVGGPVRPEPGALGLYTSDPNEDVVWNTEVSRLPGPEVGLHLWPLWPVYVSWNTAFPVHQPRLRADAEGVLPLGPLWERLLPQAPGEL